MASGCGSVALTACAPDLSCKREAGTQCRTYNNIVVPLSIMGTHARLSSHRVCLRAKILQCRRALQASHREERLERNIRRVDVWMSRDQSRASASRLSTRHILLLEPHHVISDENDAGRILAIDPGYGYS